MPGPSPESAICSARSSRGWPGWRSGLDRGEEIVIVDLRHALDVDSEPHHIPGAIHLSPDDLDARHMEIPRDRDIVLYCT